MREADLLVHPSTTEGLASVLLEAMCAGLPIVAARTGGIPELLEPGSQPLVRLVPPGDPVAMVAAIKVALDRYRTSHGMAIRAQRRGLAGYTRGQMVDHHHPIDAYRRILARRAKGDGA